MTSAMVPGRISAGEMQSALRTLAELHHDVTIVQPDGGWSTGFSPLDEVLSGGVRPGELALVGGRPGVGKTVACMQWAQATARRGSVAIYLCYEHSRVTMVTRLLAAE